jgi:ABC-2 type transport system permease protein
MLGLVLPGVGTMTVLHRIADTDIAGQLAYQDSIAAYHERLRRFYYPYLFDERSFTRTDFAQIPRYETRRATGTLDAASLIALGILALLLLVAGRARMARIGARRRS